MIQVFGGYILTRQQVRDWASHLGFQSSVEEGMWEPEILDNLFFLSDSTGVAHPKRIPYPRPEPGQAVFQHIMLVRRQAVEPLHHSKDRTPLEERPSDRAFSEWILRGGLRAVGVSELKFVTVADPYLRLWKHENPGQTPYSDGERAPFQNIALNWPRSKDEIRVLNNEDLRLLLKAYQPFIVV